MTQPENIPLTSGQRTALQNLARKQAGRDVDWINISDARGLTDLGLAERNREGWNITPKGLAVLEEHPTTEVVEDASNITNLQAPPA